MTLVFISGYLLIGLVFEQVDIVLILREIFFKEEILTFKVDVTYVVFRQIVFVTPPID